MSPQIPSVLSILRNVSKYCNVAREVFVHLSQKLVVASKISKFCYTLARRAIAPLARASGKSLSLSLKYVMLQKTGLIVRTSVLKAPKPAAKTIWALLAAGYKINNFKIQKLCRRWFLWIAYLAFHTVNQQRRQKRAFEPSTCQLFAIHWKAASRFASIHQETASIGCFRDLEFR